MTFSAFHIILVFRCWKNAKSDCHVEQVFCKKNALENDFNRLKARHWKKTLSEKKNGKCQSNSNFAFLQHPKRDFYISCWNDFYFNFEHCSTSNLFWDPSWIKKTLNCSTDCSLGQSILISFKDESLPFICMGAWYFRYSMLDLSRV